MKKFFLGLAALLLIVVYRLVGKYNTIITIDENVQQAWSQVENVYQRRADLIPNLVETVKGFAIQEKETLTAVTEARAKATQTNIDINDAQAMAQYQAAQGELSSAISRLLLVVEQYPDIKSNINFLELQAELAGTENRVTVERKRYNESVEGYNVYVRRIPQNFIAAIFNFDKAKLYFESEEGADQAPDVEFENIPSTRSQRVSDLKDELEATKTEIELERAKQELEALQAQ